MLSRSVGAMTKKHGTEYITSGYFPFGETTDWGFVLVNLESPFSYHDRDTHERTFSFASHPRNVAVLSWLGKDRMPIVSLANNHIFNAGYEGFRQTIASLEEAGITHIGLSREERVPFVALRRANRLYCFGAYTYDGREYYDARTKTRWWVNSLDDAQTDVRAMQSA